MPKSPAVASPRRRHQCRACLREFKSDGAVAAHTRQVAGCRRKLREHLQARLPELRAKAAQPAECESDESRSSEGDLLDRVYASDVAQGDADWDLEYDEPDVPQTPVPDQHPHTPPPNLRASVTEVPDEGDIVVTEEFDGAAACHPKRRRPPIEADFSEFEDAPWGPFPSEADWKLAQWAKANRISDAALSRLLDIQALHAGLTAKSARDVNKYVDSLPPTATFMHAEISLDSQENVFDLFYRDVLEVIRELIGDPTFAGQLLWTPVRHYTDASRSTRQYNEFNSGDWMWETQVKLPDGATVIPIILSSDKTELTTFAGKKSCYPVYLTIGNIPKHLRRQGSVRAQRLIAYLPTGKVDGTTVSDLVARKLRARLFHHSMRLVCEPLFAPAADGVDMVDSEGCARSCHPILAAYVADYPEQCVVTCTRLNRACPVCDVLVDGFDQDMEGEIRQQCDTAETIREARTLSSKEKEAMLQAAGLNNIPEPFWLDWPHANIHAAMTSDVLHQLIQGVGKHLVEWLTGLAPEHELDARMQRLPTATGLRHFKEGISKLSNVTGGEHKAIYAQLLGCIQGIVPDDAVRAACAMLDFIYMAQYECHSEASLTSLQDALTTFHSLKDVFIEHGARKDFKIPKLHACQHYVRSIRQFGTIDNYNTETTERLHIDLAKRAYQATNKRDHIVQMCRWLARREAVYWFQTYLAWRNGESTTTRLRPVRKRAARPIVLAKRPHRAHVRLADLEKANKVHDFRPAMESFLRRWHNLPEWRGYTALLPPVVENALDRLQHVQLWHHVKFVTPNLQTEASADTKSTAYASPKRGTFDPVLVRVRGEDVVGVGGLDGIRVGRLRAIFKVPQLLEHDLFGSDPPAQLAFVDWYSELPRREDDVNGMFPLHSARSNDGRLECAVVNILDLRRACHLFPKYGTDRVSRHLTSATVLDAYNVFYLNNRVDKDAYYSLYWDD